MEEKKYQGITVKFEPQWVRVVTDDALTGYLEQKSRRNPDSRIHGYNFGEAGRKRGAERDPRYGKKASGKALRKGAEAYGCHRLRRERGGQQPAGV